MKINFLSGIALFLLSASFGWYVCHASKEIRVQAPYSIKIDKLETVTDIVPILIIGSGPAGLMAAVYAARAHIPTVVLEGDKPGGALTQTSYIENWPGYERILGSEVIDLTRKQAQRFGALFVNDSVAKIDTSVWPFKVTMESGTILYALSIIITTGSSPHILQIPGEQEYWGKGVTTCAICDAPFHKDKDVVVIGGGDSAVEEALQLAPYAKTVTILVRKDAMRAAAAMQEHLKPLSNVAIMYNTEVREVRGDGNEVTEVLLENTNTKETFTKMVSGVFLAIGHKPNTSFLHGNIALDNEGYIKLHSRSQETSLRGIFAAGDVADKQYKQASTAIGDGVKAALETVSFLQEHGINGPILTSLQKRLYVPRKRAKFDVEKITSLERLESIIKAATNPVFVDFYAPYCPSCMMMLPAVSAVAYDMQDKATIVKVDVSESPDIGQKYHIGSLPTFLVFKPGSLQEIARYNDAMTQKELHAYIEQFTQNV